MTRYHVDYDEYWGAVVVLNNWAFKPCTDDDCTREHVNTLTDDEVAACATENEATMPATVPEQRTEPIDRRLWCPYCGSDDAECIDTRKRG